MKHWKMIAASAIVIAASVGAGAAWAGGGGDPNGGGAPAQQASGVRTLGAGISDAKFTAINPCRLVDTRVHDVPFNDGTTIGYDVRGSGPTFAGQGGKVDGCGIPDSGVTAVEVSVTAVDAAGNGYLRVFPGSEPTATFLNYTKSFNPTNTGTVQLCGATGGFCIANRDLVVKNHGHHIDLVIDVQGYYSLPMAGLINSDASISRQDRITGTTHVGTGQYEVRFDRDVSNCTYHVTVSNTDAVTGGDAVADPRLSVPTGVYVALHNESGSFINAAFYIEVIC